MYRYKITAWEAMRLRKIASRLTTQSHEHERNIVKYFEIMCESAKEEFREDGPRTLNGFLRECFEKALPRITPLQEQEK